VIVRWGLDALPEVLPGPPFLLAGERWQAPVEVTGRWAQLPSDDLDTVARAAAGAPALLALGGGSTIDTAKGVSAATGLPLVSVPTTYSGAEWTTYFGVRDPDRRMRGGGAGAHLHGIVYEPQLTLELPRAETVGTALNALAHAAEALYVRQRNDVADAHALVGARLIAESLPRVVEAPRDPEARTRLLRGAAEAGEALALSMLGLGHAIAQALGGRYGLPHGAMNALALPVALRFNAALEPDAVRRFGEAIGAPDDPAARVEELAALGGFGRRLRDFGIREDELPEVAEAAASRAGNQANPCAATPGEILALLRAIA
jgi:maleylacetate reductase